MKARTPRRPKKSPPKRRTPRAAKRAPRARGRAVEPAPGPIQHVVLLMMENRSFDHILGSLQAEIPDIDGVVTPDGVPRSNAVDGVAYPQRGDADPTVKPDPKHELDHVAEQLKDGNARFVADYAHSYPKTSDVQRREIMRYHDAGALPALHELARHFTICDRWFSSVPGPTWPNRLFALSGTSLGRVKMPDPPFDLNLHRYSQDTIFDRLAEANRSWRIYFGDFPLALLFEHERRPSAARHYRDFDDFARDVAKGDLPDFTFIEPRYLWPGTDDDHPPHDVADGQRLIATVYNALRASAHWDSTLLVITYDEHGGFYDHVLPGTAVPPDEHDDEYEFNQYGVRVPAVLVSPRVGRMVCHDTFDHTSLLRYVSDLWSLGPLGARTAHATSIARAIDGDGAPRRNTPETVSAAMPGARAAAARALEPPPERLTDLQRSIVALSQVLEKGTADRHARQRARSMTLMEGSKAQAAVAEERARRFLRQRGAKVRTARPGR